MMFYSRRLSFATTEYETPHDKTNKMIVPNEDSVSLGIHAVWSEALPLCCALSG